MPAGGAAQAKTQHTQHTGSGGSQITRPGLPWQRWLQSAASSGGWRRGGVPRPGSCEDFAARGQASIMATKWFTGAPFGVQSHRWGGAGVGERGPGAGGPVKGGWSLRTGSEKGAGLAVRGERAGLYIRLPALRFPARGPLIILLSCLKSFLKDLLCAAQRGQVAWPIAGHSAQRSWVEFSPGVFLHSPVSYAVCWVSVQWLSHVELFVTPWTAACQASLFINNS